MKAPHSLRVALGYWRKTFADLIAHFQPRFLLRLLPGTSESFGPPRRWATWEQHQRKTGARFSSLIPAQTGRLSEPFFESWKGTRFPPPAEFNWPAAGIAELAGARLLDDDAWVVAAGDVYLGEFSHHQNSRSAYVYRVLKLNPIRRLPGHTLNLASNFACNNFFHYLIEALPRAHLCGLAKLKWTDVDQIILPSFTSPTASAIEGRLGLPAEKIIRIGECDHFLCETLLQPSFPGSPEFYPSWVSEFYRNLFPFPAASSPERLYIPRRSGRALLNSTEIETILAAQGFVTASTDFDEFRIQLGAAKHIVAIHGAAMANLVFARPGTRILEITPTDAASRFFHSLCAHGGMDYGILAGPSTTQRLLRRGQRTGSDFRVKRETFVEGLKALLSR